MIDCFVAEERKKEDDADDGEVEVE